MSSSSSPSSRCVPPWLAKVLLGVFNPVEHATHGNIATSLQHLLASAVSEWHHGRNSQTAADLLVVLRDSNVFVSSEVEAAIANVIHVCADMAHHIHSVVTTLHDAVMCCSQSAEEQTTAPFVDSAKVLEESSLILLSYVLSSTDDDRSNSGPIISCIGQLGFCAAATLRCARLVAYAHTCCLTGDQIDALGCVSSLTCALRLLRSYGHCLLEWERCAQLAPQSNGGASLFAPNTSDHSAAHGLTLMALFDHVQRTPVMRLLVRCAVTVRSRSCLTFFASVDASTTCGDSEGISTSMSGGGDTFDAADSSNFTADASSRNHPRLSATRESPVGVGVRPGTLEGDQRPAQPLPAATTAATTPSAVVPAPVKRSMASRLFGFVKRGNDASPTPPSANQTIAPAVGEKRRPPLAPLVSSPHAERTVSFWKDTKGAHMVQLLEECGTQSFSDAIAAFQLLCLRPTVTHVSFLIMIDNGTRQGTPRWQDHRFQTRSSSHESAHRWDGCVGGRNKTTAAGTSAHASSMKCWTLCYASDALPHQGAGGGNHHGVNRQLMRTFESFVFLAADNEKTLLESSIGNRHLFVHRMEGYDQNNTYACVAVDGCGDPSNNTEYTPADLRCDAKQLLEQFSSQWRHPFQR
ncbi:Hypothetical protein, putative [Bodo saltans]|uniref:Uncharacterized protein n=1 Tax=Bodo saltans TaxID=75058 RepID=A0A0S4J0F4_BODSA|nr:Hypothetical protein, putative [Bodo saltans]|eukprot:CUG37067.1 Hypothetical protein, putative [Bodo saltans]